jgi:hypothetical protein
MGIEGWRFLSADREEPLPKTEFQVAGENLFR